MLTTLSHLTLPERMRTWQGDHRQPHSEPSRQGPVPGFEVSYRVQGLHLASNKAKTNDGTRHTLLYFREACKACQVANRSPSVLVELVINDDRLNKAQTCRLKVPDRQMSLL